MEKKIMGACMGAALTIGSLATSGMAATPFTTAPWNGHTGAASFTFDDAMDDQLQNLTPILEEMPDVRVTFFVSNMGGNRLQQVGAGFAKLAKMGNEIGNHTANHLQLPDQDDATLKSEVVDFAEEIEKVMADNGATVKVTALATPFCANNDKVSSVIDQHHFINRDGGWHGRNEWNVEPKWLSMQSRVWNASETAAAELLSALDTAAFIGDFAGANPWEVQVTGPSWLVLLHHGVSNEGGMSIAPADLKKAFERALENDLWVAPFSTVGAYMKAHFTMDAATATKSEDAYKVTWSLPHQHMPASIPLKVKLNDEFLKEADFDDVQKIVIDQNGKSIKPNTDGVFEIEFTALELIIRKAGATSTPDDSIPEKEIAKNDSSKIDNPSSPDISDSSKVNPTSISKTRTAGEVPAAPKVLFDAKGRAVPNRESDSSHDRKNSAIPRVYRFSRP